MVIDQCLKQLNLMKNIKILAFKTYFKVLLMKYESTNCLFNPDLIIIIDNFGFDNKVYLSCYYSKKERGPHTGYEDLNYGNYW